MSWIAGASLSAAGSVFSNLGINTQKRTFNKEDERIQKEFMKTARKLGLTEQLSNAQTARTVRNAAPKRRSPTKLCGYWIGLLLVGIGAIMDFVSLGLAAQSIIAPLSGGVSLVANVFIARLWLKEQLATRDVLGTCFIIVGIGVSVAFGSKTEATYTLDDLLSFFKLWTFIVYVGVVVVFLMCMYVVIKIANPLLENIKRGVGEFEKAAKKNDAEKAQAADNSICLAEASYAKYKSVHPFAYCALAGTFGAQNILFGKMVAVLMGISFSGDNQFTNPETYTFVAALVLFIILQQHFFAASLARFDALYVVPIFTFFFIFVATMAGAAFFSEFDNFDLYGWVFFMLGLFILLIGVKLLSMRDMKSTDSGARAETMAEILQWQQEQGFKIKSMSARTSSFFKTGRICLPESHVFDEPENEVSELADYTFMQTSRLAGAPNMLSSVVTLSLGKIFRRNRVTLPKLAPRTAKYGRAGPRPSTHAFSLSRSLEFPPEAPNQVQSFPLKRPLPILGAKKGSRKSAKVSPAEAEEARAEVNVDDFDADGDKTSSSPAAATDPLAQTQTKLISIFDPDDC